MGEIDELIEKVVQAATHLNSQREAINAVIKEWEEAVNSLNLGIEAGVLLANGHVVGYGRISGKKWGFYYREGINGKEYPIFEAPFEARLTLGIHLEHVFRALVKETKRTTIDMENATKLAKEFMAAIEAEQPK